MNSSSLEGLRIPLDDGRSGRQRRRRNRMLGCLGVLVVIGAGFIFFKTLHSYQQNGRIEIKPASDTGAAGGPSSHHLEASRIASRHFAQEVLKAMDLTVDPCSDFYAYSCGTFQEITQLEPDQNEWARAWSGVSARNNELLREVMETDEGLAGNFYKSCMNMTAINDLGNAPIQPFRRALETLKGCEARQHEPFFSLHHPKCGLSTLQPLIVQWQMIDIKVFFDWSVEVNPHTPSTYALNLMQDGITLPDPKWYYSGTKDAEEKVAGLLAVAKKVFVLAGESAADADTMATQAVDFERELAKLFKDAQHERTATQGVYRITDLDSLSPALGLVETLKALAGANSHLLSETAILIRNPDYFRAVTSLLEKTPTAHIRAYFLFRVAFILGADLGEPFLDVGQELQRIVVGQEARVPRWYKCFNSVNHALPDYVGKVFVQRYFSMDVLEQAEKILNGLRDALKVDIMSVPWLEDSSKEKASYKLGAMFFSVGFPPEWADYTGLELSGDFVQDGDRLYKWYIRHAFARLARPVQRNRWGTASPAMVDAFYSYDKNGIFVPAGILQKPFFSPAYRAARNYGAIGTILGHEMTHGFDDQGRKFDPEGKLRAWWSDLDIQNFEARAQCFVDLYSSMQVNTVQGHVNKEHVNGRLTLAENIADTGGVNIAYKAFVADAVQREGASAPSRTDKQLFFVAQAQNWCTVERKAAEHLQLLTDPHAPDRWRVNGPLSQTPAFAEAFGCPAETSMNPSKRCHVW